MNVKFLSPFVEAAFAVLEAEVGIKTAQRGGLALQRSACTTNDVTALISIVGQVQGVALYGMSQDMALQIVSQILGQPFAEFDELAQSGIGELANVITGQASKRLAEAGYEAKISPPTLILGKGTLISTLDFDRIQVPVLTDLGEFQIHLALRETQTFSPRPTAAVKTDEITLKG
ncbi:MAG: chemotaxis protein CheX [Anaerolineae bacterium]|nr:chemotaxis protein CheX [Anaerolineae bacterium]